MEKLDSPTGIEKLSDDDASQFAESLFRGLQQEWQGSLLTVERPNLPLKEATSVAQRIATAVRPYFAETEQRRSLGEHACAVVRSFLSTKELVTGIDEQGLVDLVEMALAACRDPNYFEDLELRIGYGGTTQDSPNVRTAAYLVAPKQILSSLQQNGRWIEIFSCAAKGTHGPDLRKITKLKAAVLSGRTLSPSQQEKLRDLEAYAASRPLGSSEEMLYPKALPRVVVYSAARFLGDANGDAELFARNAEQTQTFLREYIDRTSTPEVADRFFFDDDQHSEITPLLIEQIHYWAHAVEHSVSPAAIDVREKIARLSSKHAGDSQTGLRYAVAHAAYSADDVATPALPILRQHGARPEKVIMIGGSPEKLFWKVRQVVRSVANTDAGKEYFQSCLEAEPSETIRMSVYRLLAMYRFQEAPIQVKRAQLISRVGEIPVYSGECAEIEPSCDQVAKEGLCIESVVALQGIRTSVKEDLISLLQDAGGVEIADVRKIAKGNKVIGEPNAYAVAGQRIQAAIQMHC